jgi:integrase
MARNLRTPVPARQRTGSVDPFKRPDGSVYYRGRIRLGDGSLHRLTVPEPFCNVGADARTYTATTQAEEDAHGRILAAKQGRPVPASTETVGQWTDRWLAWRTTRGLSSTPHDKGRLACYVLPVLGPLPMHAVTRGDVERVVERLDRLIALPGDHPDRISWKTASNAWVLVSKMFKDAMGAKQRDLRVREDNPAAGVAPREHGDRKAVYTFMRAGELEALTWEDVDLEHGVIQINKAIDRETGEVKSTKSGEARRIPIEPRLRPLVTAMHAKAKGNGEAPPTGRVLWMPDNEDRAALLRQHLAHASVKRADLFADNDHQKHVTFHDLRATGITWMAVRGDDPLRIKQRAGHSSFSTTEMYIREAENLAAGFGDVFPELPAELVEATERGAVGSNERSNAGGSVAEGTGTPSGIRGGATGDRTPDLRIANAALSQLSYCPKIRHRRARQGDGPGHERRGRYAGGLRSQASFPGAPSAAADPLGAPTRAAPVSRAGPASGGPQRYPVTSARASSPQPSMATNSNSLNGKLTCVGLIICMPSASSRFEMTRSMTRNGR